MSTEKQIIRVYYKDNSYKSFLLSEEITAQEVCELFANDFLRLEKKNIASHFSLRVIIDGKDIRQLKPQDKPMKIQKDLLALKITWNTDQNYFLFCLSEETKKRMSTRQLSSTKQTTGRSSTVSEKPVTPRDSKVVPTSSHDPPSQNVLTKKLSFLVPKRRTNSKQLSKADKHPLTQSQSAQTFPDLSPNSSPVINRTRSENIMSSTTPSSGVLPQRQEVSDNLKKLISEEKRKLMGNSATDAGSDVKIQIEPVKLEPMQNYITLPPPPPPPGCISLPPPPPPPTNTDSNDDSPTSTTRPQLPPPPQRKLDPNPRLSRLGLFIPDKPLPPPPGRTVSSPVFPSTSLPPVPPIPVADESKKKPDTDDISNMFDDIFDWYNEKKRTGGSTSSTPREETKEEPKKDEQEDELDDETFDNILATLQTLEQLAVN